MPPESRPTNRSIPAPAVVPVLPDATHAVMVRVADVDAHHADALGRGARVLSAPATYPYGERAYTVGDPGGHRWTFSQTLADVHPDTWCAAEVMLAVPG